MKRHPARQRPRQRRERPANLEARDQAELACTNISAVADLLACTDLAHVCPETISRIGELIALETERLSDALEKLFV